VFTAKDLPDASSMVDKRRVLCFERVENSLNKEPKGV
jgi:hypothetical protein